jgi:hypothetical protein
MLCMLGDRGCWANLPPGLQVPLQQWHAKVTADGVLGLDTPRLRLPGIDDAPEPCGARRYVRADQDRMDADHIARNRSVITPLISPSRHVIRFILESVAQAATRSPARSRHRLRRCTGTDQTALAGPGYRADGDVHHGLETARGPRVPVAGGP